MSPLDPSQVLRSPVSPYRDPRHLHPFYRDVGQSRCSLTVTSHHGPRVSESFLSSPSSRRTLSEDLPGATAESDRQRCDKGSSYRVETRETRTSCRATSVRWTWRECLYETRRCQVFFSITSVFSETCTFNRQPEGQPSQIPFLTLSCRTGPRHVSQDAPTEDDRRHHGTKVPAVRIRPLVWTDLPGSFRECNGYRLSPSSETRSVVRDLSTPTCEPTSLPCVQYTTSERETRKTPKRSSLFNVGVNTHLLREDHTTGVHRRHGERRSTHDPL